MEDRKSLLNSVNYRENKNSPQDQNRETRQQEYLPPKEDMMKELKEILASTEISAKEFLELWTAFDTDGEYTSNNSSMLL